MSFSRTATIILAAALFLAPAIAPSDSQAAVIDFEDVGALNGETNLPTNPYQDLNWSSALDVIDVGPGSPFSSSGGPAHSGRFGVLSNFGTNSGTITGASGAFTFNDVWIKSWAGNGDGGNGVITGTLGGANVFSLNFIQGSSWQNLSAGAAVIDTLVIAAPSIFLIDDLQINAGASGGGGEGVPTPGALVLLGFGLLGLGMRRRVA